MTGSLYVKATLRQLSFLAAFAMVAGLASSARALTQCMDEKTFKHVVNKNFAAVPQATGFNNHMGSLLTESPTMMSWVMQAAMLRGQYFVDSRTSAMSVAMQEAERRGINTISRDVFLDYEDNAATVEKQIKLLVKKAKQRGYALGIGHPYPDTLATLEKWLPIIEQQGIKVVPVSRLIEARHQYVKRKQHDKYSLKNSSDSTGARM